MFKNEVKLTGRIKFIDTKATSNGKVILNAVLSRGTKEKGYENYKIRAFKDLVDEIACIEPNTAITIDGWLTQDNFEKDGKKISVTWINVKSWELYEEEKDINEEYPF